MLSVSNISSGQAASGYYRAEGYYLDGSKEGEQSTEYFGKGANEAGLSGVIQDDQFAALLDGQAPNGQLIGRYRDGERQHVNGIDLTFSAPKSVSIAALVVGDKDVQRAHVEAVKTTMAFVESNIAQYRTAKDGVTEIHTGGKIVAGFFHHDTSRALDPQLHSHVVMTNMVQGDDGNFRALHNVEIYRQKMPLGQLYRNALANNLERLGFETTRDDKGFFEISSMNETVMRTFSKRREQIEASLKDRGLSPDAKSSALAALATRSSKKPVDRSELSQAWAEEVKSLGLDPNRLLENLRDPSRVQTSPSNLSPRDLALRAVDFAISHLSEKKSVYSHSETMVSILQYDKSVDPRLASQELSALLADKVLYSVNRKKGLHYTDKVNVQMETDNLRRMADAQGRTTGIDMRRVSEKVLRQTSDTALSRRLANSSLTDGQKDAVAMALSSTEGKLVGIQGLAGTGKTYMMSTVVRFAAGRGYGVDGIAPSNKAVKELDGSIAGSRTIENVLTRFEAGGKDGDKSKTILVVDESSMLSSEGMNRVLRMAETRGYARVVLMGDIKQLDAVGAGSAFRQLQERGLPVALMTDIARQNTQEGRDAVIAAVSGNIAQAMEVMKTVVEVGEGQGHRHAIARELAERYANLDASDREKTAVIVMTNAVRQEVNQGVQMLLQERGVLDGKKVEVDSLDPRNFSQAEAGEVRSYQVGNIVLAPVAHKASGMQSDTLYIVTKIDEANERLTLSSPDGETVNLDLKPGLRLAQKLAVFKPSKTEVFAGDSVKFRITDRDNGIVNSFQATVSEVSETSIMLRTEDGETKTLSTDSLAAKGMQLSYSATAHDFQGSTVERVYLGMSSTEQLATQKAFYVGLSRMVSETHLVTDNAANLTQRIQENTGERINALEALAEQKETWDARQKTAETDRAIAPEKGSERTSEATKKEPEKDAEKEAQGDLFDMSSVQEKLDEMDRINERLAKGFERPQRTR